MFLLFLMVFTFGLFLLHLAHLDLRFADLEPTLESPKREKSGTLNKFRSFQRRLSNLSVGEIPHTSFTSEHQNENHLPNLPHFDQLHHASGEQAADRFFSLDGFEIPENINEKMLHPKQSCPKPKPYDFYRTSTNDCSQ